MIWTRFELALFRITVLNKVPKRNALTTRPPNRIENSLQMAQVGITSGSLSSALLVEPRKKNTGTVLRNENNPIVREALLSPNTNSPFFLSTCQLPCPPSRQYEKIGNKNGE